MSVRSRSGKSSSTSRRTLDRLLILFDSAMSEMYLNDGRGALLVTDILELVWGVDKLLAEFTCEVRNRDQVSYSDPEAHHEGSR